MDTNNIKIEAKNKMVRISPRKLRLVADTVRGKDATASISILEFIPNKGGLLILKVLKSAIANGEHNFGQKAEEMYVKTIMINEGPTYKRAMAASKGRVRQILKRTASINITLGIKK